MVSTFGLATLLKAAQLIALPVKILKLMEEASGLPMW
jgi:hypothetical protein